MNIICAAAFAPAPMAAIADDFAFATRDGLIADPVKVSDRELIQQRELEGEHTEVRFDFTLCKALNDDEEHRGTRLRAQE